MQRKELILKILEIVGYKDDKESFVNDFLESIRKRGAARILKEIPQAELQALEESSDKEDSSVLVSQFSNPSQIEQILKEEYDELLSEWLDEFKSNVSIEQAKSVSDLLVQFSNKQTQAPSPTQ